jgi:hypothetical protein
MEKNNILAASSVKNEQKKEEEEKVVKSYIALTLPSPVLHEHSHSNNIIISLINCQKPTFLLLLLLALLYVVVYALFFFFFCSISPYSLSRSRFIFIVMYDNKKKNFFIKYFLLAKNI